MRNQTWVVVSAVLSASALVLIGIVLGVVLARTGATSTDREQTALLREMVQANQELEGHLHRVEEGTSQLARSQKELQEAVAKLVLGTEAVAPKGAALPDPPAGFATVKLAWDYKRVPGEFQVFQPPEGAKLWDSNSYEAGIAVKTGAPIKDGVLFVKPGDQVPVLVQVVWKNPADKAQAFFVVPHIIDPIKHQAAAQWPCLCTGQNYSVPPKGTFSRVIGIMVTPDVEPGSKLIGTHTAVGPMTTP